MSLGGGGGGGASEIPKEGRAGRARSLGIWPGGRDHGGGEIPGTPALVYLGKAPFLYLNFKDSAF